MSAQVSRPGVGRQGVLVALATMGLMAACTGEISSFGGNANGVNGGGATSSTAGPGAGPGPGAGGTTGSGSTTGGGAGATTVDPACVPAPPADDLDTKLKYQCNSCTVPVATPLRRLSRRQYVNTLLDLLGAFTDGETIINGDLRYRLDHGAFPDDSPSSPDDKHYANFANLDQVVRQGHADAIAQMAALLGERITQSSLKRTVGECATKESDDACLTTFIRTFGAKALRRPLTDEDVAFYKKPALAVPYTKDDYADVIALLLAAPESLFLVEKGKSDSTELVSSLGAYELASRLSYHFWQTSPDDALYAAAASGDLLTEAGYAAQVDRMFKDPRTRATLGTFFDEWFRNATLQDLTALEDHANYNAIRGSYAPAKETRDRMLAEVTDAALYYTFDKPGSFDTFFRSNKSFARTDDVAQVYGVPVWDGTSEPPEAPNRAGLITRPALVATGSLTSRPIMKGVFIRKNLLCDNLGPPPANAGNAAPGTPFADTDTTRVHIEKLTEQGTCASCHKQLINGLGFATENYDPFGRLRAMEPLLKDDGSEKAPAGTVNTSSVPHVDSVDDDTQVASAQELLDLLATSPKLDACFARQYFRYTFGRAEDDVTTTAGRDSCALANIEKTLHQGNDLGAVLRAVALHPSFKTRSFQ